MEDEILWDSKSCLAPSNGLKSTMILLVNFLRIQSEANQN